MCVHINCLKEFGMSINKKLVLLFMFLTAVGICTGGFFEVFMNGEGKQQLIEIMSSFFSAENSQGTFAAFLNSFKTWLILLCLLFFFSCFSSSCLIMPGNTSDQRSYYGFFRNNAYRGLLCKRHLVYSNNNASAEYHSNTGNVFSCSLVF